MKRLLKDIHIIEIDIILDYNTSGIAASLIVHPTNISRRRKLDDLRLQILNNIAMSAITTIQGQDFTITKTYQSKKSYSYYIQFQVTTISGETIETGILFRISNHKMKGIETPLDSGTVIIREFVVKGKHYDNSVAIIQTIGTICKELRKGNIKILDEFTY